MLAGLVALLCKTDPRAEPKHKGISVLLVEHGPGLLVSRDLPKLTGLPQFVSAAGDGAVIVWSLADPGRPLELTRLPSGGHYDATRLAFTSQGALAAATECEFRVFDTDAATIASRLCAQSRPIDRADWQQFLPGFDYDPPCA